MGKKKITTPGTEADAEAKAKANAKAPSPSASAAKRAKRVQLGRVYVNASYNNTVITVTDEKGNVVAWATSGGLGFSGPKKATPFAASKVVAAIAEKIQTTGPHDLHIIVKGIGSGRDSAIRSFINLGFNVLSIKDATPIPHNGPRAPKVRRV